MFKCENPEKFALVDLHLHLDGSMDIPTVRELMQLSGKSDNISDKELRSHLVYNGAERSLSDYLKKFAFPISLLQSPKALSLAAKRLCQRLSQSGLIYAEIRFAPQLHTEGGLSQSEAVEAVVCGIAESGFYAKVILCAMRGEDNTEANKETVRVARDFLGHGVAAFDLAGAEALYATENFAELFTSAKALGVPYTIHAGEARGAESVRAALKLGAGRIGHGIRAAEDPEILLEVCEGATVLELCPTSNIHTGIFESLEEYPIKELLALGVKVTVNSDNMTVSATSLGEEYRKIADECELTDGELYTVLMNSINAAFISESEKEKLKAIAKSRTFASF